MRTILLVILVLAAGAAVMLRAIPAAHAGGCEKTTPWWDIRCSQSAETFVKPLQKKLITRGYDPGPVDGLWGPRTRAAVIRFQRHTGLVPNGGVDEVLVTQLWCKHDGAVVQPLLPEDVLYNAVFAGREC